MAGTKKQTVTEPAIPPAPPNTMRVRVGRNKIQPLARHTRAIYAADGKAKAQRDAAGDVAPGMVLDVDADYGRQLIKDRLCEAV